MARPRATPSDPEQASALALRDLPEAESAGQTKNGDEGPEVAEDESAEPAPLQESVDASSESGPGAKAP